jgi:hypothetical protein
MTYAQGLTALIQSALTHDISVTLETPGDGERKIVATIFGDALAGELADGGYPGGIEIPLSAEDLYLYPLAELEQRQAGYRTDGRTGEASPGWDESRYVIADWAANPVSIGRDGALAYSIHGRGSWHYHPIAPDFDSFLTALAHWIDYHRGERSGQILDADFEVAPEIAGEVLHKVVGNLPETEAKNLTDLLLGTV